MTQGALQRNPESRSRFTQGADERPERKVRCQTPRHKKYTTSVGVLSLVGFGTEESVSLPRAERALRRGVRIHWPRPILIRGTSSLGLPPTLTRTTRLPTKASTQVVIRSRGWGEHATCPDC
jgi:hypothetical protein